MEPQTPSTILDKVLHTNDRLSPASFCARCGGAGIKAGTRNTRQGRIQKFYCRKCRRHFCESPIPRRQYPPAAILRAVTAYNLGRTLEDTRAHVARHSRMTVPTTTIHAWVSQFSSVCTFTRLRKKFSLSPDEVLQSRTFSHKQEYKFAFHRLKTNLFCKRQFPAIRRYLWYIADHCPNDLFQQSDGARCSDGNLPDLGLRLVRKDTNAVALAKLGLLLARHSRDRHSAIQGFMLANDSATVAVEVSVYLHPNEAPDLKFTGALTGHIDVLQIRGDRVWVLDYKPDAKREKRAKYQLYLYARALSVRTGIPLSRFGLAYFDDKDYFEVMTEHEYPRRLAA